VGRTGLPRWRAYGGRHEPAGAAASLAGRGRVRGAGRPGGGSGHGEKEGMLGLRGWRGGVGRWEAGWAALAMPLDREEEEE
jgi:hypothetical protein